MKAVPTLSDDELSQELRRAWRSLPDAPAALQRAAIGLWVAPAPGLIAAAHTAWRQLAAVLSFDSWAKPALAGGMRSLRSPTRHLLFSAEGRDVDLRISPAAGSFTLAGQVLGPDEAGQVVLARDEDAATATGAALDSLGEFRIEGLAAGRYRLTLQLGGDEVVLPALEIGEPAVDARR